MAKAKKKAFAPKREFVNINGPEAHKFQISCPKCRTQTVVQTAKPTMVVDCSKVDCDKEFDLVWWRGVTDGKVLQDWLDDAKREAPSTSFDWECTSLDAFSGSLVGVSFCREDQPNIAIYVPMGHAVGTNMEEAQCKEIAAPFIVSHPMNAFNMVFEYIWAFIKWGVIVNISEDAQIDAWMDDTNRSHTYDPRSPLKLKKVARELWDLNVTDIKDLIDLKTMTFAYVPTKQAIPYGCQDSDLTTRLKLKFCAKNQEEQPLIWRLEHDLIPCIAAMQMRGIQLNTRHIADCALIIDKEIDILHNEVWQGMGFDTTPNEMTGEWEPPFDLGSSARVSEHFFKVMGLSPDSSFIGKPTKTFPKGQPSVSKKALKEIRKEFPVVDKYLQYNEATHVRDNAITKLPTYINPVTGFIHGSINATGAPTGRFSHSGPNMANQHKKRD